MKNLTFFLSFACFLLLFFSACQSPSEVKEPQIDEISSLIERYAINGSVLLLGSDDPKLLEGASVSGRTSKNIPYAQFRGEETAPFAMLEVFSAKVNVPAECFHKAGSGLFALKGYLKCVDEQLKLTCLYTYRDPSGNTISRGTECVEQ